MRKVLIATMSLGIGGAETHITELALELKRRGLDVSAASNGGVYVEKLERAGIPHFAVPMHKRRLTSMVKSYFLLKRIIKREAPDIVHAHARIPGFICGLIRKSLRFTLVTTAHFDFKVGRWMRFLSNWGEKTLAVSDDIKKYLIENYSLDPRNIMITVNGVNTDLFSPETSPAGIVSEFKLDQSKPIICNVSRLDDNAALATRLLIDIAPELHRRLPGIQILIAGDGNIFDELMVKANAVNTVTGENTVIMTGMRTDINAIVSACDLFVGVSRAALEAMAASKPVILTGNQGYLGLFTPEKEGIAIGANFTCRGCGLPDSAALLDEIVRFFNDMPGIEKENLAAYGRELVIRKYSIGKMTDDCMDMYEAASKRKYNVLMSGYYGFKNAGDEAILQSVYRSIKESCGEISLTVLSSDPADTKSYYGYDAVARFNVFRVLRALKRCDALVSGGGSLLQDLTSTRSLLYYLLIIRMAKKMGKKVMIYANGIGPVVKESNRRRVRCVIDRADVVTLRDTESAEELRSMGVTRDDIRVTADPVFTMQGVARDETLRLIERFGVKPGPFITVSIRDWPGMGDFCESMAAICDGLYEQTKRSILFVPMQTGCDIKVCRKVQGMMRNPSCIVEERLTSEELMGIIGASDVMIAMRLHALIFAARMNVPFAGIVYDPKVSAYSSALGMPIAGDVTGFDRDYAHQAVTSLLSNRDEYAEVLRQKSSMLEAAAKEDPSLLLALLQKE